MRDAARSLLPQVYEYLTCNRVNPCNGWLSSNATLRNATSAWARRLSAVHQSIADESTYPNGTSKYGFDVGFYQPDIEGLFRAWSKKTGKHMRSLIEPSDGFHPNQLAQGLLSGAVWAHLESNYPRALGPVNPHNAEIEAIFQDQGGF